MPIEATNSFVFIIRDDIKEESDGFIIPGQGREKPHAGKIFSVGGVVRDKKIRKGRKAIFHKDNGFEIEYKDCTYLVLESERIIGVDD